MSTRENDQNPEVQFGPLRQQAELRGWRVIKEYIDYAPAAGLGGRKAWRDLMKQVRNGGIDVVAVLTLHQAFRHTRETFDTLAELADGEVGFFVVNEAIDATTATGRLMLKVMAAVWEYYRSALSSRSRRAMARAKAEGKRIRRPPTANTAGSDPQTVPKSQSDE